MKRVSVREFTNVTDTRIAVPDAVSYLIEVPAANTADVHITMKQDVIGTYDGTSSDSVVFSDNNPSDDSITRTLGSWFEDGFAVGMDITISGTASNNTTYTIAAISTDGKVITLVNGDTAADETVAGNVPTLTGAIADTDWFNHATVGAGTYKFETFEYGPTGLRFEQTTGTGNIRVWVKG